MALDHAPADTTDWTPLIWAIYNGDISTVASLLDSRVNHLFYDFSGKTALHWAVFKGHPDVVRMLLERHTQWLANEYSERLTIRNFSYEQIKRSTLSTTPIELAAETKNSTIFDILIGNLQLEFAPAQFNGVWSPSCGTITRLSRSRLRTETLEGIDQDGIGTSPHTRRRLLQMAIRDDRHAIVDMLLTQESEHPNTSGFGDSTTVHAALHVAAMSRGGSRYVHRLVQHGADPNHVHRQGGTALGRAIVFGDEDTITTLLECGASPHDVYFGRTPLVLACEIVVKEDPHLPLRLVRQLLAKGASVHTSNTCSPLHTAAQFSTLEVIKELVSLGADVTSIFHFQSVLEALAEEQGYKVDDTPVFKETLEFLMGHFPPGHTFNSEPILFGTLKRNNSDIFPAFVNAGFSFSHLEDDDFDDFEEGIGEALKHHSIPTISLLLESIQDHDCWEEIGFSFIGALLPTNWPLDAVLERKRLDSFLFLFSHLVEAGLITNATEALLPLITEYIGVDQEVFAQALLDCGADRYHTSRNGYDAIALSALYGKPKTLAVLLHDRPHSSHHWLQWFDSFRPTVPDDTTAVFCCLQKAGILNPIADSSLDSSPIFAATHRGDADTVSKLILAGASIERQGRSGWRPLHFALFFNHESVAHVLVDAGADVNAGTTHWDIRRTRSLVPSKPIASVGRPLHFAAMHGLKAITQKLIALGADVNATTIPHAEDDFDYLRTPLQFALNNIGHQDPVLTEGHLSVAQLLIDCGADVTGVASSFVPSDILKFANHQVLWDILRAGQSKDEASMKAIE